MKNNSINTKDSRSSRIAKNTIMLYARMLVSMLITLYTSRVILNTLGVLDYGVYNVVTGFVLAFGFLNNAMNASVQRFLTVEFKSDNITQLNHVFSMSIIIHILLAIIMVAIAEPIGFYFVQYRLVIPQDSLNAATWIFHFSVVSLFFSILNVPYRALIITHEDMGAFAVISLLEVFAKLGVAIVIQYLLFDKLVTYGLLLATIAILHQILYMVYCKKRYKESSFKFYWEKNLFSKMSSFAGWNLIGVFAGIANNQGVNIILNLFGGPVVNAARAISFQVSGAANQLVSNFQLAANPPIMKSFVKREKNTINLICSSSKFSYLLLLFLVVPVMVECPYILKLWLKTVPENTVVFTRLVLIDILVCSLAGPLHTLFQATGNIKYYQLIISGILLLNLPVSYMLLKIGFTYSATFFVSIVLSVAVLFIRLILIQRHIELNLGIFLRKVLIPVLVVTIVSGFISIIISSAMDVGLLRLLIVFISTFFIISAASWLFALNKNEKLLFFSFIGMVKKRI